MVSAPLLPNILPHFQALVNFVTNTLPKPVLVALLYRLSILHLASRVLPTIGADSWEVADGNDDGWDDRPVRFVILSAYLTYSHLARPSDVDVDAYSSHIPTNDFCHRLFSSPL
jgi:hypothetical protein